MNRFRNVLPVIFFVLTLVFIATTSSIVLSGSLEPPGPPASTMPTNEEINNRLITIQQELGINTSTSTTSIIPCDDWEYYKVDGGPYGLCPYDPTNDDPEYYQIPTACSTACPCYCECSYYLPPSYPGDNCQSWSLRICRPTSSQYGGHMLCESICSGAESVNYICP